MVGLVGASFLGENGAFFPSGEMVLSNQELKLSFSLSLSFYCSKLAKVDVKKNQPSAQQLKVGAQ